MSLFKKKEKQTIVRDERISHSAIEDLNLISSVAPRANHPNPHFTPGIVGPVGVLGSAGISPRTVHSVSDIHVGPPGTSPRRMEYFMGDIYPTDVTALYRESENLTRRTIGGNNMPVDNSYLTLTEIGAQTVTTWSSSSNDSTYIMPTYDVSGHFVDPAAQEENTKVRAINVNQQGV